MPDQWYNEVWVNGKALRGDKESLKPVKLPFEYGIFLSYRIKDHIEIILIVINLNFNAPIYFDVSPSASLYVWAKPNYSCFPMFLLVSLNSNIDFVSPIRTSNNGPIMAPSPNLVWIDLGEV